MSVRIGPDKQGKLVASLNERLGLLQSDMAGRATAFDNAVQQILSSFTAANPGAEGHFLRITDELWKQAEQARLYEAERARETQRREALRGFETDFELFVRRPVREALPSTEQSRALSETVRADAQRFLAGQACDLPWMPLGDGFAEPIAELAGLAPERLAELFPSEHGIRCSYGAKVTALGCNLVRQGRLSAFGTWRGQVISLPPEWFKDWARVQDCQPVVLVSTAEAQRWAESGTAPQATRGPDVSAPAVALRTDQSFAEEGAEMVRVGYVKNASQAVKALVRKYGVSSRPEDAAAAGSIRAAGEDAAIDRLGRAIRELLKTPPSP